MQKTEFSLTPQTQITKNSTQNVSSCEVAMVGAATLSRHLEKLLKSVLPGRACDLDALAHTYNRRRQLAAYTGLISRQVSGNLKIVGTIRNRFAHSEKPIDFDDPRILSTLANLSIYQAARERGCDSRSIYVLAVYYLSDRLNARLASFRK